VELQELDFTPPEDQTDLHARLYRFQSGAGVICIPFWVGIQDNFRIIKGALLDLFGLPPTQPDAVSAQWPAPGSVDTRLSESRLHLELHGT
jgi:hypothetical protein